ncbi:MAG: DUF3515 family protein [Microbacterium sp.]|uniref:DUF3515 family protein n=1 Tax=Microbacterium sp. TaxID=51671 RepID=UPI003A86394F
MPLPRRFLVAPVLTASLLALTSCATTVTLPPAPDANDPLCAEVSVRLPQVVDGLDRRWTDAQATGAWGDPTRVILACGVPPPGPTTLECRTVEGVDWIIDPDDAPNYRFTTYGRTPAVEVFLEYDPQTVSSANVLRAFAAAVSELPADGTCTPRVDDDPTDDAD